MTFVIMQTFKGQWPKSNKKVTTLERLFPSIDFLYEEYGLKPDDRLNVLHTRRIYGSKYHIDGYRTNFKHIFAGTVEEFGEFCRDWYKKNVWNKKKRKGD